MEDFFFISKGGGFLASKKGGGFLAWRISAWRILRGGFLSVEDVSSSL